MYSSNELKKLRIYGVWFGSYKELCPIFYDQLKPRLTASHTMLENNAFGFNNRMLFMAQ